MATVLDNLKTTRNQIAANLVKMTADPRPNYSIDGKSVSWDQLFNSYMSQLEKLDEAIARAGGPIMKQTRMVT